MQLSNSIHHIFVTSRNQSKQPVWCSPVHEMDHLAVCDMMSDPPSFIMRMIDHWQHVICSFLAVYCMLYTCNISIWAKVACLVISGASNGPSDCWWYDESSTALPVENLISLESCERQHSNCICYIFVMSVYQSKQPFCWPLEYQMDCVATQNMISVPLSFLLMLCYHLAYAWLRQGTLWDHYGT